MFTSQLPSQTPILTALLALLICPTKREIRRSRKMKYRLWTSIIRSLTSPLTSQTAGMIWPSIDDGFHTSRVVIFGDDRGDAAKTLYVRSTGTIEGE